MLWESNPLKDGGQWGYAQMGLEFLSPITQDRKQRNQGLQRVSSAYAAPAPLHVHEARPRRVSNAAIIMSLMTFQLMIVALVLIAICIELLFLTLSVIRVAKATERVGRILDRPRKARAELQDELDQIAQAAASGAATVEDMKRADVIADKLTQMRPPS